MIDILVLQTLARRVEMTVCVSHGTPISICIPSGSSALHRKTERNNDFQIALVTISCFPVSVMYSKPSNQCGT